MKSFIAKLFDNTGIAVLILCILASIFWELGKKLFGESFNGGYFAALGYFIAGHLMLALVPKQENENES